MTKPVPNSESARLIARRSAIQLTLLSLGLSLPGSAKADAADAPQNSPSSTPYVDRLIDDGKLEPLSSASGEEVTYTKGNVRSLIVELGGSVISPTSSVAGIDTSALDRVQREAGISVSGRYQTDNFGLLGLDAQLRRGSNSGAFGNTSADSWNGSATLTSHNLPLGDGWLVDGTLGTISTPTIALVRQQTRFYLPASPILGGAVVFNGYREIARSGTNGEAKPFVTLNLSVGEPGLLGGLRLSDFTGLSGLALSGGGQIDLTSRWSAGLQAIAVRDTVDPYTVILQSTPSSSSKARVSSQGALGTIAFSDNGFKVQANAIWTHRSGQSIVANPITAEGSAAGGWIDASYRSGRTYQSGGLYYFAPGLSWGTSALINNAYGGYYRISTSSQRWRWTFNLDAADSADGSSASGVVANADVRRKLNFTTSVGMNSTVRIMSGQTSTQLLGYVEFSTHLGSSRAEVGWSHDPFMNLYRFDFNQNWSLPAWMPSGSRLSTQASYQRMQQSSNSPYLLNGSGSQQSNSFGGAISAGATPFSGINFDATIAYNSNGNFSATSVYGPVDSTGGALGILSSQQGQAFSATIVTSVRLSQRWSLTASYTDTTSSLTSTYGLASVYSSPLGVTPTQAIAAQHSSYHLRAGYLTLRYTASAGRPRGMVGLRQYPVGGTGVLEGHVFLDANSNHNREPSENGVPGIVVILDGIQAVRTDQSGYYRFDAVSDGPHRVTLNADALPLPWVIEADDKRQMGVPFDAFVNVGVRSTTILDIAAEKE